MKKLFFIIFSVLLALPTFCQKNELEFQYRFGTPTHNFGVIHPVESGVYSPKFRGMRSQFDFGGILLYQRLIWNKIGLYAVGGLEWSQGRYYLPIIAPTGLGHHLESVSIENNRLALHVGLKKRWKFWDEKLYFDLGLCIVDRYPLKKYQNYNSDFKFNNEDWIEYRYEIETFHGQHLPNSDGIQNRNYIDLNAEVSADLSFFMRDRFRVKLGLSYSRNNYFFYNYNYSIRYYYNGSTTPSATSEVEGLASGYYGVRDHYVYTSLGVTFRLGD